LVEELYDLRNDPDQMVNLAEDKRYTAVLHDMRMRESQWQAENRDYGLIDLGRRTPATNVGAQQVREAVKQNAPDLWARLESGELMATQAWKKYLPKKKPVK
ncbi:MAG: sulfatase, partial [Opitutaceae bacterium]|nr:sulfatase [Opitutaceae bacterium]